jgi:hypothetical protein
VKNINAVREIRIDKVQQKTATCFVSQQEIQVPDDDAVMHQNRSN